MNDNNKILLLRIVIQYLRQRRIAYTELASEITKLRSTHKDNYLLKPLPQGVKPIDTKFVFKVKRGEEGRVTQHVGHDPDSGIGSGQVI